jgi:hypothetical protein
MENFSLIEPGLESEEAARLALMGTDLAVRPLPFATTPIDPSIGYNAQKGGRWLSSAARGAFCSYGPQLAGQ